MKILVVDDDELIRELLLAMLEAHGYPDVTTAESGEDALRKIAAAGVPFDAFMIDIQMPGMDGIDLTRRVRRMQSYREAPILMLTAMHQKDYIDRAFLAGATDYVVKPFDTTELITRIRLAERLHIDLRRASEVAAQDTSPSKPAFAHSVLIDEIKGYVSNGVMQNYVMIIKEQKQFEIGAFAIHIPELETVYEGSSTEDFTYVITDVAEVLSDVLEGTEAFVSYVGAGVFVCVGPKQTLPEVELMRARLMTLLNDPDLVYCPDVETSFSVTIGAIAVPKLMETPVDLRFLDRAVDNLNIEGCVLRLSPSARAAGKAAAVHAA